MGGAAEQAGGRPVFGSSGSSSSGGNTNAALPIFYVDPSGKDSKNGRYWSTAFKSMDRALQAMDDSGGAELHVSDDVTGNIWLRGDGLVIPGWHNDYPFRLVGHGKRVNQFGFPFAAVNMGVGNGGGRFTPGIWLAATAKSKEFHNIGPNSNSCNQFIRQWDYNRDAAGNILFRNILSWDRTGTTATVQVQLISYNVSTATRSTGNHVQITFPIARRSSVKVQIGDVIRIGSVNAAFDSGDFVVTNAFFAGGPTYVLEYTQTTSGGNVTVPNIGTVGFADIRFSDRIEVVSSQTTNLPSTQYRVLARSGSADVFTFQDLYGGKTISSNDSPIGTYPVSGTFVNCGQWVLQARGSYTSSLLDFYNLQGTVSPSQNYDRPEAGPLMDFGGTSDGRHRFYNLAPTGYVPIISGCADPDRECWLLSDGGSVGSPGFEMYDTRPNASGVRMYGGKVATWGALMRNVGGDTAVGTQSQPAFQVIEGNKAGNVLIDNVRVFDQPGAVPDIVIDSVSDASVAFWCGIVDGPVSILGNAQDPLVSAWKKGQTGTWPGALNGLGQAGFAGDLPHVRRGSGVVSNRFVAFVYQDPSAWQLNGNVLTQGIADPLGNTTAIRVTGTGGGIYPTPQDLSAPFAEGDIWFFGTWVRRPTGFTGWSGNILFLTIWDGNTETPFVGQSIGAAFVGDGEWQYISSYLTIPALGVGPYTIRYSIATPTAVGLEFFETFLERIPASAGLSPNEIAEYVGASGPHARYLYPGTIGTPDGFKFIGHAGLGTAKHYVSGVGSGQITVGAPNGKYVELFDESGASLGVVLLASFTVNP